MSMGGGPPLGYRVQDRKLVIVDSEAEIVRSIFHRYTELGSVRLLKAELEAQGSKKQVVDEGGGSPDRRQAILTRGALPDVAEPHLSRRDRSQGPIPSRRTPADHRPDAVGRGSGTT